MDLSLPEPRTRISFRTCQWPILDNLVISFCSHNSNDFKEVQPNSNHSHKLTCSVCTHVDCSLESGRFTSGSSDIRCSTESVRVLYCCSNLQKDVLMIISKTAEKALVAYGGKEIWQAAKFIEAEVSVSGLLFTLKRRPVFRHAKIFAEIHRPFSVLTPIGRKPDISGILDGNSVRLENSEGEIISNRDKARSYFNSLRRLLYWDDLDMAYFANYAFWNYFTLPALLLREDIDWREISPGRLDAKFPSVIPTHVNFSNFGLISKQDYYINIIILLKL